MKKLNFKSFIFVVALLIVGSSLYAERLSERSRSAGISSAAPARHVTRSVEDSGSLGQSYSLQARRPATNVSHTRVFPWLSLSKGFEKELRLEDASGRVNRSRVLVQTPHNLLTWDVGLSERALTTDLPISSSAVAVRSLRPSRTVIVWKRQDKVEWANEGEEGPPINFPKESYVFLLSLRGEAAVALQFELEGVDFKVVRAPQLRPEVSLLSHPDSDSQRTKVAVLATDLQPLDSQFALFITENAESLPLTLDVLASDAEGNSVPVQIDFSFITVY